MAGEKFQSKGTVFFNGVLLARCKGAEVESQKNSHDVNTMNGGFEGKAPGPKKHIVTLNNVIPVGGYEVNFDQIFKDNEVVEVVLVSGGRRKRFRGELESVRETVGIEGAAEYNATLESGPPKIS